MLLRVVRDAITSMEGKPMIVMSTAARALLNKMKVYTNRLEYDVTYFEVD